jgi:basic membrane lipoprotein Med (substrate-binding protein (PBP1-ABC) superfamily)
MRIYSHHSAANSAVEGITAQRERSRRFNQECHADGREEVIYSVKNMTSYDFQHEAESRLTGVMKAKMPRTESVSAVNLIRIESMQVICTLKSRPKLST